MSSCIKSIRSGAYAGLERVNTSLQKFTEATHLLCLSRVAIGGVLFSHEYYNVNIPDKSLKSLKNISCYIGHTNKDKSLSILNVFSWLYLLWDKPAEMSYIRVVLEVFPKP